KQDLITMLTVEGKYIPCSEGSSEANWLLQLHRNMHWNDTSLRLQINCHNQGALTHITSGFIKARTKHMDSYYH
ncbi:hypothetical protein K440DRAFT_568753, partial [Wilcoxina mikolae CBS 423.85]